MAKNILNIDNVKGIAKYGVNEYEKVKKKERRKRFEEYDKENAWLDLSAFEDGFDALDVPKAILGTGVKTAQNFTKGLQSNLEGFLDTGTNLLSMGTEKLGMDKTTNKLRQFAQKDFIADKDLVNKTLINTNPILSLVNQGVRFKENLEDGYQVGDAAIKNNFATNLLSGQGTLSKGMDKLASSSITGNKLDSLTQTVGQISGQAALGGTGIPWQLTAFANSAGNEMNNAFQNNATAGQAFLSGLISGLVEVGTEYIGGGANKLLGMESLGSKGLAKLGSKISNKLVSRLLKIGIDASSEGLEEVLSGLGTAIGQKLTYMNDKDFNELYSSDQALDDFVMGALGTIITNVPGQVQSIRRGENAFSGLTENEQAILDKVIEERTNEAQKDGKELTKQQLNEIEDQAREDLQNGYISADMIEETLGDKFNADKDIVLREAFNERTRRRNTFNTDLNQYKNENQRKIVQKAIDSGILNDSKKTHNFVDLVSKIAADKGMDFDFTNNQRIKESGFGVEGKTVNGYVNGNTIGLNIESNNALNKTVGHEITHVLEGSEMYQALQDSLKEYVGQEQWNKRIKELTETYKNVENADVSKELTADLVGENLFNNEDFVRSLSTKDRNLFEKIYDEIKYLVKIATAGSKEKRELVKLQKVFQEAYRDSKTTKEGTQYSIKESKQMLEKQFKELTGDSKLVADAKIGRYAFQQIQGNEVEAPYSKEAMELYEKIENSRKTSSHLYHSTPADRIQSIVQNGLKVGSKQNQEGVSSTDKLYLSATEELADSFTPEGSVMLRISPNANLENLDYDLLGGEGSYTITNNIDPKYLQVKENGKWVNLLKSQYAKQTNQTKYSLTDNQGRQLTEQQQEYFKDSKVRDDEGNLLTVYHGTNANFNIFDKEKIGANTNNEGYYGKGFYFTNSQELADGYSKYRKGEANVKEGYLNLTNPFDWNSIKTEEQMNQFIEDNNIPDGVIRWNPYQQEIHTITEVENERAFSQALQEAGYDGIIYTYRQQDENHAPVKEIVSFESNQFKNVDNTNPTSNPDIRYSLSEDAETFTTPYGVEVVKNPSNDDYIEMRKEILDEYPWLRGQEPILRHTYDEEGNEYYWSAYDAQHASVEPYINKKYDTRTNQNDGWWKRDNKNDYPKDYSWMDLSNFNPDNTNYSLSRNNDIAPTKGWEVRGEDIRLQNAIAPLQEQVSQLQDTINGIRDNIAPVEELKPITEEEANRLFDEIPFNPNEEAPLRYNLTPEESKRLDFLDRLERENMLTDNLAEERNELRAKEENAPEYEEDMTPIESLNDVRDIEEVGDRSVNAYQYEHPEVKPFFQEEARKMLADLNNSTKGERYAIPGQSQNINEWEWIGAERQTSPEIEALLDGDLGVKYSYEDIRKGLNAIIEDHGAENIAVAKRIEFLLDDRLRNGYDAWDYGGILKDQYGNPVRIEPNQDYINMLKEQSWDKYYDSIPWQEEAPEDLIAPAEIEEPTIMMTPEEVSRNEVAPVRQDRDIMEMAEQQEFRQNTQRQQPKIQPKPKNLFQRAWDHIMGRWVNRNVLGDRLSRQVNNPQIKYNYDAFNNYMAEAQNNINNFQTNYNFENIGEGLNTIFNEAEKLGIPPAVFNEYLIDQENFDRWKIGKGSKTPAEESARRLRDYSIQYPQIKKVAQKVWKFGENSLQNRVDAGLMTQEQAEALRNSHPHYVPFFAELENIDKAYEQTNELKAGGLKRAKGGTGKIMPVYEALSKYVNAEKKAIRFNDTLREMIHSIGETNNFGVDERTDSTDISKNLFTDGGNYYITAYEDGKQITARVSKDLYQELARESENRIKQIEDDLALITKPLQKMNEFNRNIHTTLSLSFPVKNAIKDFGSALFNSKHTLGLIKNYLPGARELIQGKTKDAQQFLAGYGSGLTMGEFRNDTISQKLRNTKFLRKIANLNNYIELFPRFAEFKASRQAGENMQQALYNAREVTMNFSRGGTVAKAINRDGITFFNTSVQGFDKLLRNFSGENGAKGVALALTKVAILGIAPAVFNDLAFGGGSDDEDEDYKALPSYIKDNYYLIKGSNGEFIRIPKSQPLAVIGSAARRTLEKARGEEDAFEGFTKNAIDQIGVNNPLQNNILAPIIQVNSGKEVNGRKVGTAWYGGDIVPSRLQEESPRNQYDASIDTFSIWLGDKLNVSPYKINYVLDQYSGGVGDIGLPLITPEAKNEGGILAPVRDQFVVNSTDDNKYVSKFYSTKEKIPTGKDATEDDILQKKYLDGISKEMSSLYAERREVQADDSLTKKEKYERASEIKREINRLAKEGLDNYQNVKTTGDYSNVNGNEYQKTEDGWKKIKDDVSTEINSYGLTDSEKNTYFKTKSNISGIRDKYKDSKDYASKKADIVNEIRSANLPDDAKIGLYQDAYNDKMAQSYVDAGISADNYLDFKSQTFNADKDKDGKSISGSKKQKVFNYINSMDIPFEQKVILAKTEYPTYNDYNRQVIEYLNNSDIDREEMVDILKDLGFKVNGDNISW